MYKYLRFLHGTVEWNHHVRLGAEPLVIYPADPGWSMLKHKNFQPLRSHARAWGHLDYAAFGSVFIDVQANY